MVAGELAVLLTATPQVRSCRLSPHSLSSSTTATERLAAWLDIAMTGGSPASFPPLTLS